LPLFEIRDSATTLPDLIGVKSMNKKSESNNFKQGQPAGTPRSDVETRPSTLPSPTRRSFIGGAAALVTAGIAGISLPAKEATAQRSDPQDDIGPLTGRKRAKQSYNLRLGAAKTELQLPVPDHAVNGDEQLYASKIGNYSKALPHNSLGEADTSAYNSLIKALTSGSPSDFENITLGIGRKLTNPQAGLAFDMVGHDSHVMVQQPAPAFSSAEEASEIAENYWMALLRDVPFSQYATDPTAIAAAADLSNFSDFRGPKVAGKVTTDTLFRSEFPGATVGPYMSQFFWLVTPFGSEQIDRQMQTAVPGVDYMTVYADWLNVQNGGSTGPNQLDPQKRYIRNGRDLGQWVHMDVLFQAYFDALLILGHIGEPLDPGNPYVKSKTQSGFGTLGDPYNASIVGAVAKPALKAVWYQKWFVHRRLRPEEFAGRIHNQVTRAATYPIHPDILNSPVLHQVFSANGTYLLPMAFPEGCPTHPAYGAGHATVAGACVTVLKALFDESAVIPNPVVASDDGQFLGPYQGSDLTVGGELNKLATNVAIGRNIAGVHWRSDATESLKLGEAVAIRFLQEEHSCMNESYTGLSLTKFDGTTITI
jgi:hypothetical protein